jgi:hypothetical protein
MSASPGPNSAWLRVLAFAAVAVLAFAATRHLRAPARGAAAHGSGAATALPPARRGPTATARVRALAVPRPLAPADEAADTVERLTGIEAAIAADLGVAVASSRAQRELEHSLIAAARRCAPAGIAEGPTQLRLEGTLNAGDELILLTGLTAPVVSAGAPVSDQVMGCIQAALPAEVRAQPRARGTAHYDGPVSYQFVFDDHTLLPR